LKLGGAQAAFHEYRPLLSRNPVTAYFGVTFAISWMSALAIAAADLMRNQPLPAMTGILMFPAMLLGPCFAGVILTQIVDGKRGLRDLVSRMLCWRLSIRWYVALLVPPALVLTGLLSLTTMVSTSYAPNHFLIGIFFNVPAGFLEEIGWTGFAFPKLCLRKNALAASVILGVLWSIWHLPVIDHLGTATPHGASWFSFFVAFAAAMTAIHSSPDFLDLHQYKQRIAGPAHACKLHRLPCHFQSTKCDS
jgi:membrane protease YdiL (CAAX protease family)